MCSLQVYRYKKQIATRYQFNALFQNTFFFQHEQQKNNWIFVYFSLFSHAVLTRPEHGPDPYLVGGIVTEPIMQLWFWAPAGYGVRFHPTMHRTSWEVGLMATKLSFKQPAGTWLEHAPNPNPNCRCMCIPKIILSQCDCHFSWNVIVPNN